MRKEHVVLVDEQDNEVGTCEKLSAHLESKLHRAVSVLLFNNEGKYLLQQRAFNKYHSGGLWSNACCGHPRPGEAAKDCAERRLFEEMGIRCSLAKGFDFIYKADLGEGLTEHEFDHVFIGTFNGDAMPNADEAADWKWMTEEELVKDISENPDQYTYWFKLLVPKILKRKNEG